MNPQAISITAREHAELVPLAPLATLGPKEVRGNTIVTLVSPGTELSCNYLGTQFPSRVGYAAVFRATEVGAAVVGVQPGDLLFGMGNHQSVQQVDATSAVPVPQGLVPHEAVIARLMAVTMTTLMTTTARPGDLVLVTGAGPVGYLGAHLFKQAGYTVHVVEPNASRREAVQRSGIAVTYPAIPVDDPQIKGRVALVVECSGHEQSVLGALRIVRKRGEVVLVGVPWKRGTDLSAHEILHAVFHNYAVLRSGWDWELPFHPSDFRPHSNTGCFGQALQWLHERRIPLEGLIERHSPRDAQNVYQALLHGAATGLFQVFDWNDDL